MGHLLHDDILALADELSLSSDDGLEELEVLDVAPVGFDAVAEVLHHFVAQFAAQLRVVLEDSAHRLRLQQLQTTNSFNQSSKHSNSSKCQVCQYRMYVN